MKKYAVVACILVVFVLAALALTPRMSRAAGPWYVAPGGSDSNDCATPATPCSSINGALNKPGFVAGDAILVATGTYTSTGAEVVLLNKSVTLSGGWGGMFSAQTGMSIIDGQKTRLGIEVTSGISATIDRFNVQNGFNTYSAGGVNNGGALSLSNSLISNNVGVWPSGGGIENSGNLTVTNSMISDNTFGNPCCTGGGGGAGIYNTGVVILDNSTVSGNVILGGYSGSGIYLNGGILTLNSSTVSNNSGGNGEGIYSTIGSIVLNSSTVSHNQNWGVVALGSLTLQNTILAKNGISDCSTSTGAISQGYNLVEKDSNCASASTDIVNVDPLLGPLQNNGGATYTRALLPNSPAVNSGNPSGCTNGGGQPLLIDQRGLPRIGRCDIGAYEVQPIDYSVKVVNHPTAAQNDPLIYTIVLTNGGAISITDILVTDTLPSSLLYADNSLTATIGNYGYGVGVITWTGTLEPQQQVPIKFTAHVNPTVTLGTTITNTTIINGNGGLVTRAAVTRIDGQVCNIQKHSNNPVLSVGPSGSWDQLWVYDPTILKDGAIYKMWYSGFNGTSSRIGYATSSDGVSWSKYGGNPVLTGVSPWESGAVYGPSVISDTGVYKMWYAGRDSNGNIRIGYATSPDGIAWTKYGSNPVLDVGSAGSWDDKYVSRPSVIKVGSTYHLWYTGNDGITDRIGYATSTDGITWVKDPDPVLDIGAPGAWDWLDVYAPSIIAYGDKYLMWYSGDTLSPKYQTGFAISSDGVIWSRQTDLITEGAAGSFDSDSADYPSVVLDGNQFKIWYSGLNSANTYNIGYATAQVCSTNPTLPGNYFVYLPLINKPAAQTCAAYYADNFSNPTSGWLVSSDSNRQYAYNNGQYQIRVKQANNNWSVTPGAMATDFTASVSAHRTSGTSGAYGMTFGINEDWSQFYQVLINANTYSIWRYDSGWTALQNWTASNAIATGTNWNRLKVVRNGSLITVYINGQQVTSIDDDTFLDPRRIGLAAESYSTGVDTRFDDFALYPADCGSQVYRAATSIPFEMGKAESHMELLSLRSPK